MHKIREICYKDDHRLYRVIDIPCPCNERQQKYIQKEPEWGVCELFKIFVQIKGRPQIKGNMSEFSNISRRGPVCETEKEVL